MVFGIGSALKGAAKSLEKEVKRGGRSLEKEFSSDLSSFTKFATLGLLDPNEIRRLKKQEEKLAKEAKKLQLKQKRAALIRQAELQSEVAERGSSQARGGRFSLLRSGETGSLLV